MKLPTSIAHPLYWLGERLRGRGGVRARLAWLEHTQTLPARELAGVQLEKLRAVVADAYTHVPYYRRVMDERGLAPADVQSLADLARLPLLDRGTLRREQADLLSRRADRAGLQTNYSSGSTGERAVFVQDADFRMWMRAHQLRTYGWCEGWRPGEPFALLWGSEIYWNKKQLADKLHNAVANRREYNTFRLSRELTTRFLDELVALRPVLVSTYTNAMHLIAHEAERRNLRIPGLRAIQSTSEPLPPIVRERMRQVFGCEIYDKYGSRETNIVSHDCGRHDGMHIQVENVVVEIVDEAGQPVPVGTPGRVVLTTLNNAAMPLIRYVTSDVASLLPGSCPCGLGSPRMSAVAGRQQDLIHAPNGDKIDAYFFSYLIMRFPAIEWFQVVQREPDRLHLRVLVPGGRLPDGLREAIVERIHHHTGYPFAVEIEQLAEMPVTATGKFRLCVSELEPVRRAA